MFKKLKFILLRFFMHKLCHQLKFVPPKDKINNIALWQFGGVGDMLLATPVIMALCKRFPEATIQIWCSNPPFAQFLLRFQNISDVCLFKVYDFDTRTMLKSDIRRSLQSVCDAMACKEIDLVVNLHVPALLDWWAIEWLVLDRLKPQYAIGFDPFFMDKKSIFDVSLNATMREGRHYTWLYQQLLTQAGIPCLQRTQFPTTEAEKVAVQSLLQNIIKSEDQVWVCLHIGGRRLQVEQKMWAVASFASLARKLLAEGILPVLIGVESENGLGDELCLLEPRVANVIGQTSLGEMAAFINLADAFIGHDSGPFHVAVAVNTPALAICGRPDAEPEYLKYDKRDVAVLIADSPQAIRVDDVFIQVMALLNE